MAARASPHYFLLSTSWGREERDTAQPQRELSSYSGLRSREIVGKRPEVRGRRQIVRRGGVYDETKKPLGAICAQDRLRDL